MKPKILVTALTLLIFINVLAMNVSVTPILAIENDEPVSANPPEAVAASASCAESSTELAVVFCDVHLMLLGEPGNEEDPLRWEGTLTCPDGTEFLQINYVDLNAYFVGPEVDWPIGDPRGELEVFREDKVIKDDGGQIVATGFEQGLFNITSWEWNAFGTFDHMTEGFPLWDLEIVKTWVTGMVWIDDSGGWHAKGIFTILYRDEACDVGAAVCCDPGACAGATYEVVIAYVDAIFMGEGILGTGPFRWEGPATFADGTEVTSIAYADPAPYFVGPDADWSMFGQGMQGVLEIFREEMAVKNRCGDVVATGSEQGIFNITSLAYNISGDLTIQGSAGPLTGKDVEKYWAFGLVWTDDDGFYHAEGHTVYLLSDACEPCDECACESCDECGCDECEECGCDECGCEECDCECDECDECEECGCDECACDDCDACDECHVCDECCDECDECCD